MPKSKATATVEPVAPSTVDNPVLTPEQTVAVTGGPKTPPATTETPVTETPETGKGKTVSTVNATTLAAIAAVVESMADSDIVANAEKQATSRAQMRADAEKLAHAAMQSPEDAEALIHKLQPFYSSMYPRKYMDAYTLCEQGLIHAQVWRSTTDATVRERARLDVQSTLVHLASRAPRSVRDNATYNYVLQSLVMAAQSMRKVAIVAEPIAEHSEALAAILARENAARIKREKLAQTSTATQAAIEAAK